MTARGQVLVVDDEEIARDNIEHVLQREGFAVTTADDGAKALALLARNPYDVVITDLRMDRIDGIQLLQRCRQDWPETEVVIVTGYASLPSAVDMVKLGAFHYLAKPFRLDELRQVVTAAAERSTVRRAAATYLDASRGSSVTLVTRNNGMEQLLRLARQIAPTECNVLISGESGTGKELFARYVHHHSLRRGGPFLAVNCGAFSEDLLVNELFGHARGAYTGANAEKKGLIEMADGGTLFLDEVTEMSAAMQVKLLRVVQERELLRVGGTETVKVDVRFVAATNRNPQEAVASGRFRQDFYFRLNVINLHVPPLAERRDDIPLLADYFLRQFAELMKRPLPSLSEDAVAVLKAYDYPGNVRELRNAMERATAIAPSDTISVAELPEAMRNFFRHPTPRPSESGRLPSLETQEKEYIRWVLAEANGNQTLAARILGIDRVSLWRKLKRYCIDPSASAPPRR